MSLWKRRKSRQSALHCKLPTQLLLSYGKGLIKWVKHQRQRVVQCCLRIWLSLLWHAPKSPRLLGIWGEIQAMDYLRSKGAKLLKANYRAKRGGEADLVVRDGEVLAFVEVKTRRSLAKGRPASAVDKEKFRLLRKAAYGWLRMLGKRRRAEIAWRIDIAEVLVDEQGKLGQVRWNKAVIQGNTPA